MNDIYVEIGFSNESITELQLYVEGVACVYHYTSGEVTVLCPIIAEPNLVRATIS